MSKKKTDSNHIFYYSQTLEEILDMQLDLNMQEIGFTMVFKAAYIYHKGTIPINKLCQFCRVFEKQEIFVNFIEKNYEKKGKFYYSKQYQKEVNLIIKNSKSARNSVLNRWKKDNTNVSTNEYTSTSNTNNNVNVNTNNNTYLLKKEISSEAKKAQEKMLEDEKRNLAERSKKYTLFQFQVATQLGTHIVSIKNISLKKGVLPRWANQIRLLQQIDLKPRGDAQSTKDITAVMEAIIKYGSNTEFFPVIESGGAFREKFLKIENFLNQSSKKPKVVKDWENYNSKSKQ